MQIDRALQKEILEIAKTAYPNPIYEKQNQLLWKKPEFVSNIFYLNEHGLIESHYNKPSSSADSHPIIMAVKITCSGIDFLEDDGGLSAILNKILIKFDDRDLEKLLVSKLSESNLPATEKNKIMETIKNLPAEGIKTVYTHLLNQGLKNLQDLPQAIERIQEIFL